MDWCKENCSADPNTPLNKEAHPFLPADRYYNEVMPHINFTLREFRLDEINRLGRKEPNPDLYLWTNLTNFKLLCPSTKSCCLTEHEDCYNNIDNTGQPILVEEEIMLIYGGISQRTRYINGTDLTIYDRCEFYDEKFDIEPENRPFSYRNCAEEILGDLWRYHIRRNVWTFIKLDYGPS